MTEREKVIEGLQEAVDLSAIDQSMTIVEQWVIRDALALLKAQEPKIRPWMIKNGSVEFWHCGNCDVNISYHQDRCPYCGQAVKWDD